MKKIIGILGLLLVVGLIGYAFYWVFKPSPTVPHNFDPVVSDTFTPISYDTKTITEDNTQYKYNVSVEYPEFKNGTSTITSAINKSIDLQIKNEIGQFKKNAIESFQTLPAALAGSTESSFLEVKYEIEDPFINKNLLSIYYPELFYSVGAAHPGHRSVTSNFDLQTGKKLELKDFFIGDYLYGISQLAVEKLKVKLGEESTIETITTGAGPQEKNFDAFFFKEDGMHIIFDDYEVAPYASGPQEIVLRYEELRPFVSAQGPIASFFK